MIIKMELSNVQKLVDYRNSSLVQHFMSRECRKFLAAGSYLLFLLLVSIILNVIVLLSYNQKKKTSIDIQIITILVSNIFATIFCLPITVYSNLICHWKIPPFMCTLSGGAMYFNGCVCIFTMTSISIDRYWFVTGVKKLTILETKLIILGLCIVSLFWTLMPIFGWSQYIFKNEITSCSIDYASKTLNSISYNIGMFIFVFFLPIIVISVSNLSLIKQIRSVATRTKKYVGKKAANPRKKNDNLTIRLLLLSVGLVITWTPYAVSAFVSSFTSFELPPDYHLTSSLVAKTSLIWTPVFFIATDGSIRAYLMRTYTPLERLITFISSKKARSTTSPVRRNQNPQRESSISSTFYYKPPRRPIILYVDDQATIVKDKAVDV